MDSIFFIGGWIAVGISVLGALLNSFKNKICFYLWIPTCVYWMIYNFYIESYSQVALFFLYMILDIIGLLQWSKKTIKENRDE